MTGAELPGLADACAALAEGRAVLVPNPSPMTYGIVATTPHAVNALKGRPLAQNVAVSLHDRAEWEQVADGLDLPVGARPRVDRLLRTRLSLLLPVRDGNAHPEWVSPAVQNGFLAVFNAYWEPTGPVWERFPRLYGSSANRTGQRPAGNAVEARAGFGNDAPVIDGDRLRDLARSHAASTMVKVGRDGTLTLHRPGAQDLGYEPAEFLQQLSRANGGTSL